MKTRYGHLSAFVILILLSTRALSQAPFVLVQDPAGNKVFGTYDSAYVYAQAGDYLYFSGGYFTSSQTISKLLHFVGAGINPDSTKATGFTHFVSDNTAGGVEAPNCTFDGIFFNFLSIDTTGVIVSRCACSDGFSFNSINNRQANSATFNECIIFGLAGYNATVFASNNGGVVLNKCIWDGVVHVDTKNAVLNNCILINEDTTQAGYLSTIHNAQLNNCVILGYQVNWSLSSGNGSRYTNCMFTLAKAPDPGSIYSGCLFGIAPNKAITSVGTGGFYAFDAGWNLHLASNSPGKNYGTDGTDVGIYGTANPFSEGSVPYNPHIISKSVSAGTNGSGELSINFKVAAQPY